MQGRRAKLADQAREQRDKAAAPVAMVAPLMDRAALLAAMVPRGREGGAEDSYRALWRTAIAAVPPDRAIDRAAIDRIEIGVARAMLHRGFTDGVVYRMVCDQSPLRATDAPSGVGARADQVLAHALTDPLTRRIRDEKAAEQAEWKDRAATVAKLNGRQILAPTDPRFIDLWQEILGERPLDTTVPVAERNRSIDHEVATVMLHEGVKLLAIRSAILRLSPGFRTTRPGDRAGYIDGQMDVLAGIAERLPPERRQQVGPMPVPMARTLLMIKSAPDPQLVWPEDDGRNILTELPDRLPTLDVRGKAMQRVAAVNDVQVAKTPSLSSVSPASAVFSKGAGRES